MPTARAQLPPTTNLLLDPQARPYFLWWTDATVASLREHLRDPDPEVRAYWLGALLREANTRDVWQFTSPQEIRGEWLRLLRYLGRARAMWAFLLELDDPGWPPRTMRPTG
jgi:hypothetical protein